VGGLRPDFAPPGPYFSRNISGTPAGGSILHQRFQALHGATTARAARVSHRTAAMAARGHTGFVRASLDSGIERYPAGGSPSLDGRVSRKTSMRSRFSRNPTGPVCSQKRLAMAFCRASKTLSTSHAAAVCFS
jgi:hypothetical protein